MILILLLLVDYRIIDCGASTYMIGTRTKFVSLYFSNKYLPVHIVNGSSLVAGNGVICTTTWLTLNNVLIIFSDKYNPVYITDSSSPVADNGVVCTTTLLTLNNVIIVPH